MMDNLYNQKIIQANTVFDHSFADAKMLYLFYFNLLPSMHFIGQIDGERAFEAVREKLSARVRNVHTSRIQRRKKGYEFDRTILVLEDKLVIEFDQGYCELFHDGKQPELIEQITGIAIRFRQRQRRQPLEINLIVQARNRLELKSMEIKGTKLDLDLFYEDDFKEVDEVIRKRLRKKNDKGIVLLHGLPGTGKTTYIRYLVGKIRKRVLFLSPTVADNLMNPEFVELLIDNPNSVLIIEDAEHIIMDRRYTNSSSVSNLLNISDGLLADFLNVQLICTFNSSVTMIDQALLRKGRLIAKYEFGKLNAAKGQRLSDHLGSKMVVDKPMTIAEIANPHQKEEKGKQKQVIGFRRETELMN